jgi:transcriptional regulator with XRE-family HTH domain
MSSGLNAGRHRQARTAATPDQLRDDALSRPNALREFVLGRVRLGEVCGEGVAHTDDISQSAIFHNSDFIAVSGFADSQARVRLDCMENLRDLRLAAGLTQQQLAEAAGINQGYLSDIERGKRVPSVAVIEKFAEALGVNAAILTRRSQFEDRILELFADIPPEHQASALEMLSVFSKALPKK